MAVNLLRKFLFYVIIKEDLRSKSTIIDICYLIFVNCELLYIVHILCELHDFSQHIVFVLFIIIQQV